MKKSVWIEKLPQGYSVRYWNTDSSGASRLQREWKETYDEAQRRKSQIRLSLTAKQSGDLDPTTTFSQCYELYLKEISTTHRLSTINLKRGALKSFLPFFSTMIQLNPIRIKQYKEKILSTYSITTTSIWLRELRAFSKWALKNGYLRQYPFENITVPPGEEVGRKLEIEEIKNILTVADSRFVPYLLFLVHTGARRAEIFKTRWSDLDLKAGVWTIPKEHSKTKSERTVPLHKSILEALAELPRESDVVFHGWTLRTPKWYLDKALKTLQQQGKKISGRIRIHDFRHSFASHWNGDVRLLMDNVGWKTFTMVKRYSHFNVENIRKESASKGISSQL